MSIYHSKQLDFGEDEPLNGDVHVGDIVENEVDELLILFLTDEFNERLGCKLLSHFIRSQSIFSEREVEIIIDY